MFEALKGPSSLQPYQLKALIEGMLADARRGIADRARRPLGQPVEFIDFRFRGLVVAARARVGPKLAMRWIDENG